MNIFHKELLSEIRKHAGEKTTQSASNNYLGSGHYYYSISVPVKRKIVKNWLRAHKDITVIELTELIDSLILGKSYEEKTIAGLLIGYLPKQRKSIKLSQLEHWLNYTVGWAEVDTFCQSNFSAKELSSNWNEWKSLINKLSKDKNINKKRAALVLLTDPISEYSSNNLSNLAFQTIDVLKTEKSVLITKAISWLLRSMIRNYRQKVSEYLNENADYLPKIAIRETKRKLLTGKK